VPPICSCLELLTASLFTFSTANLITLSAIHTSEDNVLTIVSIQFIQARAVEHGILAMFHLAYIQLLISLSRSNTSF
jgi:hypothetical protein